MKRITGKSIVLWLMLVVFSANYMLACYYVQYPSSADYPHKGAICIVYNFSPWKIKVLPLGDPLSIWSSSGWDALPGREIYHCNNDPLLSASPVIPSSSCKLFCLPIKALAGFKFHVLTKRFIKDLELYRDYVSELGLYEDRVKDFTIFVLQQNIERQAVSTRCPDLIEQYCLEIKGLNNDRLLHFGSSGVNFAGAPLALARLEPNMQHTPVIARWLIGRKILRRKVKPKSTRYGVSVQRSGALPRSVDADVLPPSSRPPMSARSGEVYASRLDEWLRDRSGYLSDRS